MTAFENKTWEMAGTLELSSVLRRVGFSLSNGNFPSLNFETSSFKVFRNYPERPRCYWSLTDWIWQVDAIYFTFCPISFLSRKQNIVVVVCPLNSIIEDQLKVLKVQGITGDLLQLAVNKNKPDENLFEMEQEFK